MVINAEVLWVAEYCFSYSEVHWVIFFHVLDLGVLRIHRETLKWYDKLSTGLFIQVFFKYLSLPGNCGITPLIPGTHTQEAEANRSLSLRPASATHRNLVLKNKKEKKKIYFYVCGCFPCAPSAQLSFWHILLHILSHRFYSSWCSLLFEGLPLHTRPLVQRPVLHTDLKCRIFYPWIDWSRLVTEQRNLNFPFMTTLNF